MTDSDKHSSLLRYGITCGHKKVCVTEPRVIKSQLSAPLLCEKKNLLFDFFSIQKNFIFQPFVDLMMP